jgi:hypothetical protein
MVILLSDVAPIDKESCIGIIGVGGIGCEVGILYFYEYR